MTDDERPPPGPHTCERCYERATVYIRDSRCVGWSSSAEEGGSYFLRWEPDGPFRFFCARHKRQPREFDRELVLRAFADEHPELVTPIDPALAEQLKGQRLMITEL